MSDHEDLASRIRTLRETGTLPNLSIQVLLTEERCGRCNRVLERWSATGQILQTTPEEGTSACLTVCLGCLMKEGHRQATLVRELAYRA